MGLRGNWPAGPPPSPYGARGEPMTMEQALSALEMAAARWTPHGGPWLQVPGEALVLVLREVKASVQAGAELQRKAAERDALVSLLQDVVKAVPR